MDTTDSLYKKVVVSEPEFTFYLEYFDSLYFFHCDVHSKWTKELKEKMNCAFEDLLSKYQCRMFALIDNPKLRKFAKVYGWKKVKDIECKDGILREIWSNK